MNLTFTVNSKSSHNDEDIVKTKYDYKHLPQDWLCSENAVTEIDRLISVLEESDAIQRDLDIMYKDFVTVIKAEMCEKLSSRTYK